MTKIPFTLEAWLKDKSQKVETRNGRPAHYIGLDRAGWQVFEVFRKNGTSEYRTYHDSYLYSGPGESTFDLFIVTPEEEMSEFEMAIHRRLNLMNGENLLATELLEETKGMTAELLALARKELFANDTVLKEYAQVSREQGKAEALKDLPRWKKCVSSFVYGNVDNGVLFYKYRYIHLSDLEKLPGFKED